MERSRRRREKVSGVRLSPKIEWEQREKEGEENGKRVIAVCQASSVLSSVVFNRIPEAVIHIFLLPETLE